ncbi:50S ribosomal subunit protein L23 [Candidatus Vidania fulgoroideae]|nr:50S ribosomal subunit protein L23 [Candidatus Vidania fulgoroideae]
MKKIKFTFLNSLKRINDFNKNKKISFITDRRVRKGNVLFLFRKRYKIVKINSLIKSNNKKMFILSIE